MEALRDGDIERWIQVYAPDAVHEFPFSREGRPGKLEGREAIAAYMGQLPASIRYGSLGDVRVREVGDELIVEATGHHRRVVDDARELG